MWLREVGPQLAHFFPGLPDLRSLSPVEVASYLDFRYQVLTRKPHDEDEEDWDADG